MEDIDAPKKQEETESGVETPLKAPPPLNGKKKKKKPNKLKKKGFMLKLDGIFAGGGPPGMMPGMGGPPPWKKLQSGNSDEKISDGNLGETEGGQASDAALEEKDNMKPPGPPPPRQGGPPPPGPSPPRGPRPPPPRGNAQAQGEMQPPGPPPPKPKEATKPKEQNLNVEKRKPKMAGGRRKGKKKKFNPKKTAFASQPVREYKKTDYKATALKLTEKQRVEVMMMVKNGNLSVDEAMKAVLEHDKNVREALNEQTEVKEVKRSTFKKNEADFKQGDLSKLSDEQRMKVMMLVKDGKISVQEAIAQVGAQVGKPVSNV